MSPTTSSPGPQAGPSPVRPAAPTRQPPGSLRSASCQVFAPRSLRGVGTSTPPPTAGSTWPRVPLYAQPGACPPAKTASRAAPGPVRSAENKTAHPYDRGANKRGCRGGGCVKRGAAGRTWPRSRAGGSAAAVLERTAAPVPPAGHRAGPSGQKRRGCEGAGPLLRGSGAGAPHAAERGPPSR
jgi:hypothetical protein